MSTRPETIGEDDVRSRFAWDDARLIKNVPKTRWRVGCFESPVLSSGCYADFVMVDRRGQVQDELIVHWRVNCFLNVLPCESLDVIHGFPERQEQKLCVSANLAG